MSRFLSAFRARRAHRNELGREHLAQMAQVYAAMPPLRSGR